MKLRKDGDKTVHAIFRKKEKENKIVEINHFR